MLESVKLVFLIIVVLAVLEGRSFNPARFEQIKEKRVNFKVDWEALLLLECVVWVFNDLAAWVNISDSDYELQKFDEF